MSRQLLAVRYAHLERTSDHNFLGGDDHRAPMPLDYFVWVIRDDAGVVVVDTGFDAAAAVRRGRTLVRPVVHIEKRFLYIKCNNSRLDPEILRARCSARANHSWPGLRPAGTGWIQDPPAMSGLRLRLEGIIIKRANARSHHSRRHVGPNSDIALRIRRQSRRSLHTSCHLVHSTPAGHSCVFLVCVPCV